MARLNFGLIRLADVLRGQNGAKEIRRQILEEAAQASPSNLAATAKVPLLYIRVPDEWLVWAPKVLDASASPERVSPHQVRFVQAGRDKTSRGGVVLKSFTAHPEIEFLLLAPKHAERLLKGHTVVDWQFPGGLERVDTFPGRPGAYVASPVNFPLRPRRSETGPPPEFAKSQAEEVDTQLPCGLKTIYVDTMTVTRLCNERGIEPPEDNLYHPRTPVPPFPKFPTLPTYVVATSFDEGLAWATMPDRYRLKGKAGSAFVLYWIAKVYFSGAKPPTSALRRHRRQRATNELLHQMPELSSIEAAECVVTLIDPSYSRGRGVMGGRRFTEEAARAVSALDGEFGKRDEFVSDVLAIIIHASLQQFRQSKSEPGQEPPKLVERLKAMGFDVGEELDALAAVLTAR